MGEGIEEKMMRMIWCPETATKAYIDTVKSCGQCRGDSGAPEFISAMAGGWKANLIVEAWCNNTGGAAISNSIGLALAAHHSGGRHVCIVTNEKSRQEYIRAMQSSTAAAASVSYALPEVMVGKAEELMERLNGIDFLLVDGLREDFGKVTCHANFGHHGAVAVLQNVCGKRDFSGFGWKGILESKVTVARSMFLPIGNGLDIAYVAGGKSSSLKLGPAKCWVKHIDQQSGEEHVFRITSKYPTVPHNYKDIY